MRDMHILSHFFKRALIAATGLIVLCGAAWYTHSLQSDAQRIAQRLQGEHWYKIEIGSQHIGYMYNHASQSWRGDLRFETTTHFLSEQNEPTTITRELAFDGRAPHALVYAHQERREGRLVQGTRIETGALEPQSTAPYRANLTRNSSVSRVELDWQFTLADFLGFELWLDSGPRSSGDEFLVRSIDFERLRITAKAYSVVERADHGYVVQTATPFAATRTRLDPNFVPQHLSMAGVFEIRRSDESEALALTELRNKTDYLFPLNARLDQHETLQTLTLRAAPTPPQFPDHLTTRAGQASVSRDPDEHTGEDLRYPITHNRVQELVAEARIEQQRNTDEDLVDALMRRVSLQLEYAENQPAGSVLAALASGTGECADFAELMTTLARAAGLPARTQFGIAYKDGATPSMMFHAWNEIFYDQRWHVIDPTWSQRVADATHVPLSDAQAALLMLTHNKTPIRFEVIRTGYAGS